MRNNQISETDLTSVEVDIGRDVDITCKLGGNLLKSCLYNASGSRCTSSEELQELFDCSGNGAVLSKSCTTVSRMGNPLPRYKNVALGSINSMGIPNYGVDHYLEIGTPTRPKSYFISVSGMTLQENKNILQKMYSSENQSRHELIELNLSCPNIVGHPQIGYDFETMEEYLRV